MTVLTADTVLEITRVFDATPERVFDAWLRGYNRSLKAVLRFKFATLMVSASRSFSRKT